MSIKTEVLWSMASRYQKAALNTDDHDQAEAFAIKACRYYEMWEEAVEGTFTVASILAETKMDDALLLKHIGLDL